MEQPVVLLKVQEIYPEMPAFASKKPRNFLLPLALIGMALCAILPVIRVVGLFDHWEKFTPPPAKPTGLMGTSDFFWKPGNVYIQVEDGEIYAYSTGRAMWLGPESEIPELNTNNCSSFSVKFFPWKRPFPHPYQCVMAFGHGDITPAPEFSFALDQDGILWGFAQLSPTWLYLFLPIAAAVGALAGVMVNFVWLGIRRIRINKVHVQISPYGLSARAQEAKSLKVVARIWSLISILYFITVVIEDRDMALNTIAVLSILALIIAWRWPLHGGIAILILYLIMVAAILLRGHFADPYFIIILDAIFYFPGLLFILSWRITRKYNEETSQVISHRAGIPT
jgi:hypothetical protein